MLFIEKNLFQDMNTKQLVKEMFEKKAIGYMNAQKHFDIIKFYQV